MSDILFIRHAETGMAGTFCGHSDPPINASGQQQVEALIAQLSNERLDAIYCSDLRRAIETAKPLAQAHGAPLMQRSSLREIDFGDWEGLTWAEIELRDPAHARRWLEAFPHTSAPRGESFADFEARILDEIDELLMLAEQKRVAVVTHGGVLRVVLRALHGCCEQEAWSRTKSYCCSFTCTAGEISQEMSR